MFKILNRGQCVSLVRMLEATFIFTMDSVLCRQKEFVHSLIVFQSGNNKAVTPTAVRGMHANGESSALGASHPLPSKPLVRIVSHLPVLRSSQLEPEILLTVS